jgi:hypothetical protein
MAEDPIPLTEQARYHLDASDIPVDAAVEPSVDDRIAKSSVNPSREDLLAEGAKQARIHGVGPECARVYAQGWAQAKRDAQGRVADLERQLRKLQSHVTRMENAIANLTPDGGDEVLAAIGAAEE